jgi:hypothetical protein
MGEAQPVGEAVMIPTEAGHGFRFEAGHHSEMKSATPMA